MFRFVFAILFIISGLSGWMGVSAQPGLPLHFNYDYGNYKTHPLMWSAAQNTQGVLYFANNDGVVQFDGARWSLLPTPNSVRSVAVDTNNNIYVGGKGDFGWFEPMADGSLVYRSLKSFLSQADKGTYDINKVYASGSTIYFLSESLNGSRLIRAKKSGKKYSMRVWSFSGLVNSGLVGNTLYLNIYGKGLHTLSGEKPSPIPGGDMFANMEVVGFAPINDRDFVIATHRNGAFIARGGRMEAFNTPMDAFFRQSTLYDVSVLKSGNFAFATSDNGIAIVAPNGTPLQRFNTGAGLPSGSMYFLFTDQEGGLWAGHGKGLSCLLPDVPMHTLAETPGMKSRVTSLLEVNNRLYVATISGVYFIDNYAGTSFTQVSGLSSECRSLVLSNGQLLVASNDGIYVINGATAKVINNENSAYTLTASKKNPGIVYAALDQGLAIIQNGVGFTKVDGITEEVNSIVEAGDGTLWCGTTYQGLLKAKISGSKASVTHFGKGTGVEDGYVFVQSIGDEVFFETDLGVFTNEGKDFVRDEAMTKLVGGKAVRFAETKPGKFWVWSMDRVLRAERSASGEISIDSTSLANLPNAKLDAIAEAGDHIWLAYNDQVMYLNLAKKEVQKNFKAVVRQVVIGADSTIMNGLYWDEAGKMSELQTDAFKPDIDHKKNSVTIDVAATSYLNPDANLYQFWLEGADEGWSNWQHESKVKYNNLREGNYTLKFRARNATGETTEVSTYSFNVQPPWYRTILAYLGYLLLAGGLVFVFIRLNARRLEAQNKKLEQTVKERTHEVNEQKKELEVKNVEVTQAYTDLQNTQNQLVQSEKMAALGNLIANIAHEINTPIGAINGSASNITKSLPTTLSALPPFFKTLKPDEEALFFKLVDRSLSFTGTLSSREERQYRKTVQTTLDENNIEGSSNLSKELVKIGVVDKLDEFLPLFRLSNANDVADMASGIGRIRMNLDNITLAVQKTQKIVFALKTYSHRQVSEAFELTNLVNNVETVITLYSNQLKHGVDLSLNFDRSLPEIEAHADELIQVWTNIVHNALQAMNNEGSLTVDISREGPMAVVKVIDSGPGIPEHVLPKIFDAFFTTKAAGEGSGLGLDICMKIIRKHNGMIDVDTKPGHTAFIVKLPFKQPELVEEAKATAKA